MKEIIDDLIQLTKSGKFDIIAHGCNCFCVMNGGFAKQIKDNFLSAWSADQKTEKGDYNKLGNYSFGVYNKVKIYNCYTQYNYGTDKVRLDYEALTLCLRKINFDNYTSSKITIGLPKIGCGLAGGDWNIVKKIIEKELKDMDVTIINLKTK